MANKNLDVKKLCLELLHADSENEVVTILKRVGYWDDTNAWRLYGDKEGNFSSAGSQQASSEAALVEKIVNSCDSRLMCECQLRGIDPESDSAPRSVRDAVSMFFESAQGINGSGGNLSNWPKDERTKQSRFITIAATGDRPTQGRKSRKLCLTIADQAEGQSPRRLPNTILSLNAKNKQRIRFVQGKFNMGGTGVLRFCENGLQLIITRRNPELAKREKSNDPTVEEWGLTIVRREEPSNKSGDPVHSEFTYLAPIGIEKRPREGEVLSFKADALPLMPEHDEPYARNITWGTAIKLYEYETKVGQSNVLMKDGLMYAIERLLPEIALPIRIHECRGYKGDKERSFETPIAGLVVRLEDGKGDNLEPGFPKTAEMHVAGMKLSARIYAFKEERAATYLRDEGVIFTINGQSHGHLPKSIFTRPKAVGLPRLKDSLLVLVDCTAASVRQREDLFMSTRDRLSQQSIRFEIEGEIEQLLKNHPDLKRLQMARREHDVKSSLSEDRPLEEVLERILSSSPTLRTLFLKGQRLSRPFTGSGGDTGDEGGAKIGETNFSGKKHPTFFRIVKHDSDGEFRRNCEIGRRSRIAFETDVENEYFDRLSNKGTLELEIIESSCQMTSPNYTKDLDDGVCHLNMALPSEAAVGDELLIRVTVTDPTLLQPFINLIRLHVAEKIKHKPPTERKPKDKHSGSGVNAPLGIKLPTPIPVHENDENWQKYHFTQNTACHVISDPIEENGKTVLDHIFYINVDNSALKTEMKYSKQDPRLLEAKFKYANVLLGLAMLHEAENNGGIEASEGRTENRGLDEQREQETVQDKIRWVSSAVAPVLIPTIDQLSGLSEELLEEISSSGEEA